MHSTYKVKIILNLFSVLCLITVSRYSFFFMKTKYFSWTINFHWFHQSYIPNGFTSQRLLWSMDISMIHSNFIYFKDTYWWRRSTIMMSTKYVHIFIINNRSWWSWHGWRSVSTGFNVFPTNITNKYHSLWNSTQ